MAIVDNLKDQDDLEQLMSELARLSEQVTSQTKAINGLIGEIKATEDVNDARLERVAAELLRSASQKDTSETESLDQLKELKMDFRRLTSSLKDTKTVKLPNGQTLTRADFTAYSLTRQISQELQNLAQNSADQAKAVRGIGTAHVDTTGIADHAVKDLDTRLAAAVEKPMQRIEATLDDFEHRVADIGTEKLIEVTAKAETVVSAVSSAESRVDKLANTVSWSTVGKICQALIPFTVAFIILGSLVGGFAQMLGVGPIFEWAWTSFSAAEDWTAKVLITVGTLGGVGGFGGLIYLSGKIIYKAYRGW